MAFCKNIFYLWKVERNKKMSKFNKYAKQFDAMAKKAFANYREAKKELQSAQKVVDNYPEYHVGMSREKSTPQYQIKVNLAKANLEIAKQNYRNAQEELQDKLKDIEKLRKELVADIKTEYSMKPELIDSNTMELLKSGIMKSDDYKRLIDKAIDNNNFTMMRMIAKYANDATEEICKKYGTHSNEAVTIRQVVNEGENNTGKQYLDAFDSMQDVYSRAVKNDTMIDYWEQFTAEIVEDF